MTRVAKGCLLAASAMLAIIVSFYLLIGFEIIPGGKKVYPRDFDTLTIYSEDHTQYVAVDRELTAKLFRNPGPEHRSWPPVITKAAFPAIVKLKNGEERKLVVELHNGRFIIAGQSSTYYVQGDSWVAWENELMPLFASSKTWHPQGRGDNSP